MKEDYLSFSKDQQAEPIKIREELEKYSIYWRWFIVSAFLSF
jgi:hypothetical protein